MQALLLQVQHYAERTFDVFFYGLYMDAETLAGKGVVPRDPRLAFVEDHVIRLGKKAMLLRSRGTRAVGMLYRLNHQEMDVLYADADDYRPQALLAIGLHLEASERPVAALTMVHREPPIDSVEDPDYASRWRELILRLGISDDASSKWKYPLGKKETNLSKE